MNALPPPKDVLLPEGLRLRSGFEALGEADTEKSVLDPEQSDLFRDRVDPLPPPSEAVSESPVIRSPGTERVRTSGLSYFTSKN